MIDNNFKYIKKINTILEDANLYACESWNLCNNKHGKHIKYFLEKELENIDSYIDYLIENDEEDNYQDFVPNISKYIHCSECKKHKKKEKLRIVNK